MPKITIDNQLNVEIDRIVEKIQDLTKVIENTIDIGLNTENVIDQNG